ncbi:hypothetical protein SeMB42_g03590 [Synchytrium endobioticum]|uniref:DNA repair and recombination protein RAD54B n=1 Tax=Synchytrium endobioticum TaxID=286115 RepID=A0A507D5I6_9FUNG|nr:hypothetical protein SeLEV6574_g06348 [Synchytrium endobioticum]TPX46713.1 hypothetical protein SeMB42_g03590 [Synchytrium endobioticum]
MRRSAAPSLLKKQKPLIRRADPSHMLESGTRTGLEAREAPSSEAGETSAVKEPDPKRRKLVAASPPYSSQPKTAASGAAGRGSTTKSAVRSDVNASTDADASLHFTCVWRKKQARKHKTWDGDGVLIQRGKHVILQDEDKKEIGKGSAPFDDPLADGSTLVVGGREVEITGVMSKAVFEAQSTSESIAKNSQLSKPHQPSGPTLAPFKVTVSGRQESMASTNAKQGLPKHNPFTEGAVVMPWPSLPNHNLPIVDVVLDPVLSQHLRPHQVEGVKFLYECVMGIRSPTIQGCILADAMGLGKSLQAITLIWTLLKQSPYVGEQPIIKRALIVCPASLVQNWKKEFKKWCGDERLRVFVVDGKSNLKDFTVGRVYSVLVASYERVRQLQTEIEQASFDILICDEGHRLKNSEIKTVAALHALPTRRRIILSGTPLQNDLLEFYAMCDFVNPGILGDLGKFRTMFETPIARGRDPSCTPAEADVGKKRESELSHLTKLFILRRRSEVNAKYLPPKSESGKMILFILVIDILIRTAEYVLFCKLSESQEEAYTYALCRIQSADSIDGARALQHINKLRMIANAPWLNPAELKDIDDDVIAKEQSSASLETCGKLLLVRDMLRVIKSSDSSEKVVLVSNYTRILDAFTTLAKDEGFTYLRLDGKTAVAKRQELVDRFNGLSHDFLFLLSAKAGGVGLNLVGASRLILFDIDWNPAICRQAMGRVWRDGTKSRHVRIYRLLVTGTIEEKMYQRQLTKEGLSDSVMDSAGGSETNSFTADELKDLFSYDSESSCITHDQMNCECQHEPPPSSPRNCKRTAHSDGNANKYNSTQLQDWSHIRVAEDSDQSTIDQIDDDVLKSVIKQGAAPLSFLFSKHTQSNIKSK